MAARQTDIIGNETSGDAGNIRIFLMIVTGLIGVWIGSKWVVEGAVYAAAVLGLSQSFIGFTIVALGTSLPELATSAVAAFKKNPDIAVGNIVGSNIFNRFFILGISSLLWPLPLFPGIGADIGVVIFASLLLFFSMFTGKKRMIDRWEGVVFLALYFSYLCFLLKRG
jgi:cation:H+ antiporter